MAVSTDVIEMEREISEILGAVIGAEKIETSYCLQFLVTVKDEDGKLNVEKVAEELVAQADKHGISLEIVAATKEELEEAKARYQSMMS